MNATELVDARKKAETAVKDMDDGPLKVAAFQKILEHLLGASTPSADSPPPRRSSGASSARTTSRAGVGSVPKTSTDRVLALRDEGFFDKERSLTEIRDELRVHGWVYPATSLSGPVQTLVQRRELRRALASDGTRKVYRYVKP